MALETLCFCIVLRQCIHYAGMFGWRDSLTGLMLTSSLVLLSIVYWASSISSLHAAARICSCWSLSAAGAQQQTSCTPLLLLTDRTDRQTPEHCIEPAVHTVWTASVVVFLSLLKKLLVLWRHKYADSGLDFWCHVILYCQIMLPTYLLTNASGQMLVL